MTVVENCYWRMNDSEKRDIERSAYASRFPGTAIQYNESLHPQIQELLDSVMLLEDKSQKYFIATRIQSIPSPFIAVVVDLQQVILFQWKTSCSSKEEHSALKSQWMNYRTNQRITLPSSKGGYRPSTVVISGEYLAACSSEGLLRLYKVSGKPQLQFEVQLDICPLAISLKVSLLQSDIGIFLLSDSGDIFYVSTNRNAGVKRFSKSSNRLLSKVLGSAFQAVTFLRDREEREEEISKRTAHKIWTFPKSVVSLFKSQLEKWSLSEDGDLCTWMWSLDVETLKGQEIWYHPKEMIAVVDAEPFQDRYIVCLLAIFWEDDASTIPVRYRIVLVDISLDHVPRHFTCKVPIEVEHVLDKNRWKSMIPKLTISGLFSYILFPLDGKVFLSSLKEETQVKQICSLHDWGIDTTPIGLMDVLCYIDTLAPSEYTNLIDSFIGIMTKTEFVFRFPGFCAPLSYVPSQSKDRLQQNLEILFVSFSQFIHGFEDASKWSAQSLYMDDMDQIVLHFLTLYLDRSGGDYSPMVNERIQNKAFIFRQFLDFTLLPIWKGEKTNNIFSRLSKEGKQKLVEYIQRTMIMEQLYELENRFYNEEMNISNTESNILLHAQKALQEDDALFNWTIFDSPSKLERLVETLQVLSVESKKNFDSLLTLDQTPSSEDKTAKIAIYRISLLQLAQIFAVIFNTCKCYVVSIGNKIPQQLQLSNAPLWLMNVSDGENALLPLLDFLLSMNDAEPSMKEWNVEQLVMAIGEFIIALRKENRIEEQNRDIVCDIAKKYLKQTIFEIAITYRRYESVFTFLFHSVSSSFYSDDDLLKVLQSILTRALSENETCWKDFVEYSLSWLEKHGRFRILLSLCEDESYRKALLQYIEKGTHPRLYLRWLYNFQAKEYSHAASDLYTYVCLLWQKNESGSLDNCHILISFALLCLKLSENKFDWEEDLDRRLYLIKVHKELSSDIQCLLDTGELVKRYVEESPIESEKLYQRCGIALEIIERSILSPEESARLSDYVWCRCIERELHLWQFIAQNSGNEQMKQKQFSDLAFFKLVRSTGASFHEWKQRMQRLKEENEYNEQHWTRDGSLLSFLLKVVYMAKKP